LAALSVEYAFKAFSADAQFLKVLSGLTLYRTLPGGSGAAGLRLGYLKPIGTGGDQPANLQVPIGVRFFAGGRVSHRAFATDRLGIVGQTLDDSLDPIGGNALVLLNLEYRLRLRGALSGVLFIDGGNVWAEPALVRMDDVRWGLGAGLRFDTPAGPLRLEYGYKLDRVEGESSGEVFLSFGEAF
jgi:outer membrane protein assembly factor BamA